MSLPVVDSAVKVLYDLLMEQYKDTRTIGEIVKGLGRECDLLRSIDDETVEILDVDAAEGVILDVFGRICGEPRSGRVDAMYRPAVKAAFLRRYNGTPEEIIRTVKESTGATVVQYIPEYPAAFWIAADMPGVTREMLERAAPAGVSAFPACILSLTTGEPLVTTQDENILVVGPCDGIQIPDDHVWDGGEGPIDPATFKFKEPWPFRDGTGIGEYPSGGVGPIEKEDFTFTDGSYAKDIGKGA